MKASRITYNQPDGVAEKEQNALSLSTFCMSLFIPALFSLAACTTSGGNYEPELVEVNGPPVVLVIEVPTGSAVVTSNRLLYTAALQIDTPIQLGSTFTLDPGVYPRRGTSGQTGSYWLSTRESARTRGPYSMPWTRLLVMHGKQKTCVQNFYGFLACANQEPPEETMIYLQAPGSVLREITYLGKNGDVLSFSYVERPRFPGRESHQQTLSLDMTASKVLQVQEVRLRVHEATEDKLAYEVLQGFRPPSP